MSLLRGFYIKKEGIEHSFSFRIRVMYESYMANVRMVHDPYTKRTWLLYEIKTYCNNEKSVQFDELHGFGYKL